MAETVALYTVTSGKRLERARERLSEALGDASVGEPDDAGVLSVSVDAESADAAEDRVRAALADSGTGDDFVVRETTEGREIPAADPRQPGAGVEPDASQPVAEPTGAAAEAPPAEPAGEPRSAQAGDGGDGGGDGAPSLAKFAAPALAGLLLALLLRRLRR